MARRGEVEMVEGSRGPESSGRQPSTEPSVPPAPAAPTAKPGLPPGTYEYHSRYAISSKGFHIVQLTAPGSVIDSVTGIRTMVKPVKLVFRDGRAIVKDPEVNARVRGDEKRGIPPHPNYGLGKDFWDAREALAAGRKKAMADAAEVLSQAVDSISGDPEQMKFVLERLGITEYTLPSRKKQEATGATSK